MGEMVEKLAILVGDCLGGPGLGEVYRRNGDVRWRQSIEIVDAVLNALREPTPEMLDKGMNAATDAMDSDYDSDAEGNRHEYSYLRSDAPALIWQAMIDAALSKAEVE